MEGYEFHKELSLIMIHYALKYAVKFNLNNWPLLARSHNRADPQIFHNFLLLIFNYWTFVRRSFLKVYEQCSSNSRHLPQLISIYLVFIQVCTTTVVFTGYLIKFSSIINLINYWGKVVSSGDTIRIAISYYRYWGKLSSLKFEIRFLP